MKAIKSLLILLPLMLVFTGCEDILTSPVSSSGNVDRDKIPPSVKEVFPEKEEVVNITSLEFIGVAFSEPVFKDSIQFVLQCNADGYEPEGSMVYSDDGDIVNYFKFYPDTLFCDTWYNASVLASDTSGNTMEEAFNWRFKAKEDSIRGSFDNGNIASIDMDETGAIYALGYAERSGLLSLVKFSPNGELEWSKTIQEIKNMNFFYTNYLKVRYASNKVYVLWYPGRMHPSDQVNFSVDIYDTDGNLVLGNNVVHVGPPSLRAMEASKDGLYLAGFSCIMKVDFDGNIVNKINTASDNVVIDQIRSIAVDDEALYASGAGINYIVRETTGYVDLFLAKYSLDLSERLWVRQIDSDSVKQSGGLVEATEEGLWLTGVNVYKNQGFNGQPIAFRIDKEGNTEEKIYMSAEDCYLFDTVVTEYGDLIAAFQNGPIFKASLNSNVDQIGLLISQYSDGAEMTIWNNSLYVGAWDRITRFSY